MIDLVASPVTSTPRTPGRDIKLPEHMEESPRTRERRVVAEMGRAEMGRRGVAEAMRPLCEQTSASASPVVGPVTKQMMEEACSMLVRERHPDSSAEWLGPRNPSSARQERSGNPRLFREGGRSHNRDTPHGAPARLAGLRSRQYAVAQTKNRWNMGTSRTTVQRTGRIRVRKTLPHRYGRPPTLAESERSPNHGRSRRQDRTTFA